jgi:glycosyltransferase involved in cell wall biosynthesis
MSDHRLTLGIVTISFNQGRFLPDAVDSVRTTDPSRLRYVIVDPGSTDDSRDIIEARRDRFSEVIMEPDAGPSDGLNKGFARCGADILGYLNSDDRFADGALDFVLGYFERHPEVDVIMGAVRIIDEDGKAQRRRRVAWSFSPLAYLEGACLPLQQGTFFRRAAFEKTAGFRKENRSCWDTELLVDLVLAGARLRIIHKVLGDFRIYPESITGSRALVERVKQDRLVIRDKVLAAGLRPASRTVAALKRAVFRAHPVRRILEWTVR